MEKYILESSAETKDHLQPGSCHQEKDQDGEDRCHWLGHQSPTGGYQKYPKNCQLLSF